MPQYPERISAFRKWANLKVDSGKVGLGDKKSFRIRRRRRRRKKKAAMEE